MAATPSATLIQQGHELGNHTWSHADLRLKPLAQIRSELESIDRLLQAHGSQAAVLFRSPFGHSLLGLPHLLKQWHQPNVLWTVQLNDWRPDPIDVMMQLLELTFHSGAIILLHDGDGRFVGGDRSNPVELVKRILAKYRSQGYQFVTISDLLTQGTPQHHWH